MADVIQFWEMQMSTHRTGKYKHGLSNGRDYSKYNRERKRLRSNNECKHESFRTMQNCSVYLKGNQVLGMIRRNITYKDKSLIVPLYKAIVRPHLEYCIQAWSPYLRKDLDMLEKNTEESN